jgi:ATP-dependent RNA helicase DeaD
MLSFQEMGLNDEILQAIADLGFESPTEIQTQTIPYILNNDKDLVGLAQTGTGKTASFGLPILNKVNIENKDVQAIILCPTRELCVQITSDMDNYSKYLKKMKVVPVYGGASIEKQIRDIEKGPQIIVGTPGRVKDLQKRGVLNLKKINFLVLDEADEMLNMGFKEELDEILSQASGNRQTLLFSATMPAEIKRIANNYMNNPFEITIGKKNTSNADVSHEFYTTHERNRYYVLKRLADFYPSIYGIIFCRTRQETKDVSDKLINDGYNVDALHGDLSQQQRDYVMKKFRSKNLQILVATDVAARGIDVTELTHIINYNLPDDPEVYIHRSGRTGRAGNKGISITIINPKQKGRLRDVERIAGQKFTEKQIPNAEEICEKQLFHLIDVVDNVSVNEESISGYLPRIYEKLEHLSREELIQRFVSVEFNRFLDYYKDAEDLSVSHEKARSASGGNVVRFFVNIGKAHRLDVKSLIGLINEATRDRTIPIGTIDLMNDFSFFEIDSQYEDVILEAFEEDVTFRGQRVSVEVSKPRKNFGGGGRGRGFSGGGGGRSYGGGGGRRDERRSGGYSRGDKDSGGGRGDRERGDRDRGGRDRRSDSGSGSGYSRDGGSSRRSSGGDSRRSSGGGDSRRSSSGSNFRSRKNK